MSAIPDGPALTPLALDQIALLQRLRAQDFTSKSDLAAELGRDRSNLNKTLTRLQEEGLADMAASVLTDRGHQALDQYMRMIGGPATAGPYRTFRYDELEPDALNPRQERSPERIAELKDGIVSVGRVLEQILVRQPATPGGKPRIKAGVTRWEAVGLAVSLGELPADFPIPADYRESSDAETRLEATAENDQRADLNHIERARAYEDLAVIDGMTNAEISRLVGRSPEYVQQHRRLLRLPQEEQAKVAAKEVSLHQALRDLATPREQKAWSPTAQHALVLAEVAAACAASSYTDGSVLAGRSAQHDGLLNKLVSEGYAGWSGTPDGARVWLSDTGKTYAAGLGHNLSRIQLHAGVTPRNGAYATDWLPVARATPRAQRPGGLTIAEVEAQSQRRPGFVEGGAVRSGEPMAADDDVLTPIDAPRASSPPKAQDSKPRAEDAPRINSAQLVMLVETVHAALGGRPGPPGFAAATSEIAGDRDWQSLLFQGLAMTMSTQDGVYTRVLRPGLDALDQLDLNPLDNPGAVAEAWAQAGVDLDHVDELTAYGHYVTPWLNPSAATNPEAPAAEPGEGADSHAPAPSPFLAASDEVEDEAPAATEEPTTVHAFALTAVQNVASDVADYMREVAEDGDFDCSKATCQVLAEKIAFYFAGETVLGVIGAAAVLYAKGGAPFSERNLRHVWDQLQRRAMINDAFLPELDCPVSFGFDLTMHGDIISSDDHGLIASLGEGVGPEDAAAMAAAPELLRAITGLLAVSPNFAPDDDVPEALKAWRYAFEVRRRVAERADV